AGESHAAHPGIDLEERGRMIVGVGPARIKKRHLINMAGHFGKEFGNPRATLAVLLELERRTHERADLVGKEAGCLVKACQFFSVALGKLRLVIPGVDVTRAAVHEQPDDRLRLDRKMRLLRCEWIAVDFSGERAAS